MSGDTKPPSFRRWVLPVKVAVLTTLIGPLAGTLCIAAVSVVAIIFSQFSGGADAGSSASFRTLLVDAMQIAAWFAFMGYMFGTVPALASGLLAGSYVWRTGKSPGRYALLIGALMPPLCLVAIGVTDLRAFTDASEAGMVAAAMLLGLSAAFLTSHLIGRLLKNDFAHL